MLSELGTESVRVTSLAARFECALPVASKHIRVLERAGLVTRQRQGREHRLRLDVAPLAEASAFIERYQKLWEKQFDQLGVYLNQMAEQDERVPPSARRRKTRTPNTK